jgi:hypothetical protein
MSKLEEFKQYRDKFGMNQLNTSDGVGGITQNGALFTLEYLLCVMNCPDIPDSSKDEEVQRLREVYKSLEIFPGVSVRVPGSDEFDSMDNTGAIATFSGLFDNGRYSKLSYNHGNETHAVGVDMTQWPADSLKYYKMAGWISGLHSLSPMGLFRWIKSGFTPKMFWNNNTKNLFCLQGWHGRSPGHIAYLKMTAGKFVGPLGCLAVLIGQFIGCFKDPGDTDARKLPYCNWQFLKKRSFIWNLFYKLWCHVLIKQYGPEGIRAVYSVYYGDKDHPIRKYSRPYAP